MKNRPNDRLDKRSTGKDNPKILNTLDLKIPDKEVHLMHPDEKAPTGSGTCSCNSVCTCVPVSGCNCNMVCTCDSVCATNLCACNPYSGCTPHTCSCVPVCTCHGHCSTGYWYPN